jgi:hypothetical protein
MMVDDATADGPRGQWEDSDGRVVERRCHDAADPTAWRRS